MGRTRRESPRKHGRRPAAGAPASAASARGFDRLGRSWAFAPIASVAMLASACLAQRWQETCGRTAAGSLALQQAARDARSDAVVLLVASHPDDRYPLPAVWLRTTYGYRVAVLLATRGGGGQNSLGPETGDALERIRTLETEAGCALVGASAWYLNRPDCGFRRSAAETFAEWGRTSTLLDLVRLLREIRPDAVITTHQAEEQHGHDLALVELLPEAARLAADPACDAPGRPHTIRALLLGAGSTLSRDVVSIDADRLDVERGQTMRRIAYAVLSGAHLSPGPPASLDSVFEPWLRFEPVFPPSVTLAGARPLGLPSIFDPGIWPWERAEADACDTFLMRELPELLRRDAPPQRPVAEMIATLRAFRDRAAADGPAGEDVRHRLQRRIEALERLLLALCGVQIEVEAPPGTVAVAGEEFACAVRVLTTAPQSLPIRAEGLDGLAVALSPVAEDDTSSSSSHLQAAVRVPLAASVDEDPMLARFRGDRFVAPVRIRFVVPLAGIDLPVDVTVPVEQHAPVELGVVPRMLLLPSARTAVQFSVGVTRNTQYPVEGDLEVRAPAGYAIADDRARVRLRDQRAELFQFEVTAPADRRAGVDVLRIRLGRTKVALPVHKIDVAVPPRLRIGVLRSGDDTLVSVLGVGGLGLDWSELTDADIAAADLHAFDTIVVDIRALRDRPAARRGFRRLLDFAAGKGHRLVLFYQKDFEFHPSGEAFRGAPFDPFQISKSRVTRADAPVTVLAPDHVLLQQPNRIRPSDWDGWEQERALYLPRVYSADYEELLEIHDPDLPPERGALLYARTGAGEYVYCALALWRQLKKLHPGAVRLLANLLTPHAGS